MGTLGRPAARAPLNTGDIPDNTITSAKIAPDVLTAADVAPNAITASELADDAVDTAAIAADAVDGTKIADNAIDSEHYAAGSVDATAIANDAVDSQHYAADSIDAEHYAAGSVDTTAMADNAVTLAKMAGGTDGQIITYDASGNPVAVGPGTAGQVLKSAGAGAPPVFGTGFDPDAAQVFNESGADVDFRVESDDNANMLFVNAGDDEVGIGTATTDSPLTVAGNYADSGLASFMASDVGDTDHTHIKVGKSTTSNEFMSIGWRQMAGAGSYAYWGVNNAPSGTGMGIGIYSSGIVSMPNQPSFRMHLTSAFNSGRANDYIRIQPMAFSSGFDVGGNCTTGSSPRFTAPVTGVYEFVINVEFAGTTVYDTTTWSYPTTLKLNGTTNMTSLDYWKGGANGKYGAFNIQQLLQLSAGDYIEWWCHDAGNSLRYPSGATETWFTGKLIA